MPSTYEPLKQHAAYLRLFWEEYGIRRKQSNRSKEDVIRGLQMAGHVFIYYSIKAPTPDLQIAVREKKRERFDKVKNLRQRYMFKPGDVCFACGNKPDVRHHIIWLKHGGRNVKRNICFLCKACHAEVHPWLKTKSI